MVKRKRNNKKQDSKGGAKQTRSCVFTKTRFTPVHVFVRLRFGATRVYGGLRRRWKGSREVWEEVQSWLREVRVKGSSRGGDGRGRGGGRG